MFWQPMLWNEIDNKLKRVLKFELIVNIFFLHPNNKIDR